MRSRGGRRGGQAQPPNRDDDTRRPRREYNKDSDAVETRERVGEPRQRGGQSMRGQAPSNIRARDDFHLTKREPREYRGNADRGYDYYDRDNKRDDY